jgi:hypothetical protein
LMGIVSVGSVSAAEDLYRPTLGLEVTLPGVFNNNFGLTRTNQVEGFNATPTADFTFKTKLSENLTFTAIAGVIVDRYDKTGFDGDTARSVFRWAYTVADWTFGVSYEGRWLFTPTFEDLQVRLDNYVFLVTAPTLKFGRAGNVTVSMGYRERQATDVVSSNHSSNLRVAWEKQLEGLGKDWKAGAEFLARYLVYDQGRPQVARDLIASQELSLTRALTKELELKFSVAHEARNSNIREREYDVWTGGVALSISAQIF